MSNIWIEKLEWDSSFFGFPVGRAEFATSGASPADLKSALLSSGCKLVYVFKQGGCTKIVDEDVSLQATLSSLGGRCYDIKTTYKKRISRDVKSFVGTCAKVVTPELESLAIQSGWCSRFYKDRMLRPYFKGMYKTWLTNDFINGKVIVRTAENRPIGMATISIKNDIGKIGLVAVDEKVRGQGIGTGLMKDIDYWLKSRNVDIVEVTTQGENIGARRLYEKVGFMLHTQTEVWHFWL